MIRTLVCRSFILAVLVCFLALVLCQHRPVRTGCRRLPKIENVQEDYDEILEYINGERNKFALGNYLNISATNMIKIEYNVTYEEYAWKRMSDCKFLPASEEEEPALGKCNANTFAGMAYGAPILRPKRYYYAISKWQRDYWKFDTSHINSYVVDNKTKEFTQLVWASSKYVGCVYRPFLEGTDVVRYYICIFCPGGNIIGETIYEEGPPCSNCPTGYECHQNYTALCTNLQS